MRTHHPNRKAAWKTLALPLTAALVLAACNTGPSEAELAARAEADKLRNEVQTRDSLIGEMTLSFDQIEKNITLLDEREHLLGEHLGEAEMTMDRRKRMVRDIQLMNGLLQESRERITALTARLDRSSIEAGGLRKKLKELDAQLVARDAAITSMRDELVAKDFQIEQVTDQLTAIELEIAKREAIIEQQETAIHTAYYIIGTGKDLEERGVVSRTGGFIGLGKSTVINGDATANQFREVDTRETSRVPIGAKKATLVTEHPTNSYTIVEQGDEMAYLEIKDPDAFWRVSKYMVVAVK